MIHFPHRQEVRKRIGHVALVLGVLIVRSMILSAQSVPNNSPLDLDQIGKEYGKNAVNADLLYKGKVLTVRGKVVSIGNGSVYKGTVGSVRFKSYIVNGGNSWSCVCFFWATCESPKFPPLYLDL